ncbi:MAG TPA: glycosyltransferase family 4 protein [Desulfopila sp.]|nr:glycosyltransferase family 4 protein [Desulfopila sp.]
MKILILAPHPFFQNRGTPIALRMLLETLAGDGHDLTAMVYPEGEEIDIPNCRILRVRRPPLVREIPPGFSWKKLACDAVMFRMAGRLLRHESFDLIHAGEESVFMARYFSKRMGIPYVYDMDSSLPEQLCEKMTFLAPLLPRLQKFEKQAVADSLGVIAVCRYLEELARSYSNEIDVQRLEDISLLSTDISEEKRRETDLKLARNTVNFMYVGNLEEYQGIDLLLSAFSLACLELDNIRLVIIGGSKATMLRYRKKAKTLGIAKNVLFAGPKPVDDLACYLTQADVLVSPRIKGYNTPMKIYSYLDSGRPVLATRLQTHTQVLDDSIACLSEAEESAMAAAVIRLAGDAQLRKQLAESARERVAAEYNRKTFNTKLRSFYARIEQKIGHTQQVNE